MSAALKDVPQDESFLELLREYTDEGKKQIERAKAFAARFQEPLRRIVLQVGARRAALALSALFKANDSMVDLFWLVATGPLVQRQETQLTTYGSRQRPRYHYVASRGIDLSTPPTPELLELARLAGLLRTSRDHEHSAAGGRQVSDRAAAATKSAISHYIEWTLRLGIPKDALRPITKNMDKAIKNLVPWALMGPPLQSAPASIDAKERARVLKASILDGFNEVLSGMKAQKGQTFSARMAAKAQSALLRRNVKIDKLADHAAQLVKLTCDGANWRELVGVVLDCIERFEAQPS